MSPDLIQLAVLGDPIIHSKSPAIHQSFAKQWGHSVRYDAIQCPLGTLEDQLNELYQSGFVGLNLTVPLKEHALGLCIECLAPAKQAGAVNTLIRGQGGWIGTNTDGQGWVDDAASDGVILRDKRILMVGAGGAAAGLIGPLLAQGIERLLIMNRTLERALSLCERFTDPRLQALALEPSNPKPPDEPAFDLLIHASSQGHLGGITLPDQSWLSSKALAFDLNYGVAHQPMRDWCVLHGVPVFDGLGMLVRQAALSFQHWTGFLPTAEPVIDDLREPLTSSLK